MFAYIFFVLHVITGFETYLIISYIQASGIHVLQNECFMRINKKISLNDYVCIVGISGVILFCTMV